MPGQPQETWLSFDVTKLVSTKEAAPPVAYEEYIVKVGEQFDLEVTFGGNGQGWQNMCDAGGMGNPGAAYEVRLFAQGLGPNAPDIDFTPNPLTGNLAFGSYGPYTKSHPVAGGIATEGVYRCAAVVTFPTNKGVLGYNEEHLMLVSSLEST